MTSHDPTTPVPCEAITVWIVEDNEDFRETMEALINNRDDMQCPRVFETCEAMLATLNTEFAPEVLLMDISLPGMTGIDGVRRLKTVSPATHVIMLTIHEDNDTIFNALCAGASGYLLKMSPAEKIFEAITATHQGGSVMNAQIARRVLNMFTQFAAPKWNYDLTEREKEVLQMLVDGKTKAQIGEALFLSYHTIDTHMRNIYTKLHVHSRSDAVVKALRERLV